MQFPKLRAPRKGLKAGYSAAYVERYARWCVYLALKANSVDWEQMTREEMVARIPRIPENTIKDSIFIDYALKIDRHLMEINTWHM